MMDSVRDLLNAIGVLAVGGVATRGTDGASCTPTSGPTGATADDGVPSPVVLEEADEPDTTVEVDQLFEIMKNQRRRHVVRYILASDGTVTLGELAEQIAAWETGKELSHISSQERKRVYVGLYQCHLQKMDAAGAISYNRPRGRIEPGEHTELFEQYLPEVADTSSRHLLAYRLEVAMLLGLAALGIVLLFPLTGAPLAELVVASIAGIVVAVPLLAAGGS